MFTPGNPGDIYVPLGKITWSTTFGASSPSTNIVPNIVTGPTTPDTSEDWPSWTAVFSNANSIQVMKKTLLLLLSILISLCDARATSFSETNNGIYITISGSSTNEVIEYNDSLAWRPFCDSTNYNVEINYPSPAYGIQIQMLDSLGNPISKTEEGKTFGTKFDKLHNYQDLISEPKVGYSDPHIGSIRAQGRYDLTDAVSGRLLPSPKELFEIDKAGTYTLEIQMQMFLIHKDTGQWTRELVRFSPIKIKVEKPADR
jgi:hypothetical protein